VSEVAEVMKSQLAIDQQMVMVWTSTQFTKAVTLGVTREGERSRFGNWRIMRARGDPFATLPTLSHRRPFTVGIQNESTDALADVVSQARRCRKTAVVDIAGRSAHGPVGRPTVMTWPGVGRGDESGAARLGLMES
jgi:hypothetical protein